MSIVLFVCEHGAAKSVIAAAHFNRLAAERGVDLRAISRGTVPDPVTHPAAVAGLALDGLEPASPPQLLQQADLATAQRVVVFSELPPTYAPPTGAVLWTVPPVSEDYESARRSILTKLELLISDLAEHS